ncbi:7-deoxyloganetin glucosyltransferase-like [Prunus yedoensis var. nudiflora]|uniref:7-deoxyloganetin glucosyltransferase-like n=1 Tax=Prunus yedoensis var. nudiflora TaxID=2094558 RepID=A0A314Y9Q4_PRUYE|nr:7-deoxyloganetin glucosyltransferase-like [Prunus yedoensis var. nudiflora]
MESLTTGVPMICWPFFADHRTNCYYACNEWGSGMEIDNDVKRDEVEMLVRELMEGERRAFGFARELGAESRAGGHGSGQGWVFRSEFDILGKWVQSRK